MSTDTAKPPSGVRAMLTLVGENKDVIEGILNVDSFLAGALLEPITAEVKRQIERRLSELTQAVKASRDRIDTLTAVQQATVSELVRQLMEADQSLADRLAGLLKSLQTTAAGDAGVIERLRELITIAADSTAELLTVEQQLQNTIARMYY